MTMKTETVALYGFGEPADDGGYGKGGQFGELLADDILPIVEIKFDKIKTKSIVIHPELGEVPHYQAIIYDVCMKAYEILIKRMEN